MPLKNKLFQKRLPHFDAGFSFVSIHDRGLFRFDSYLCILNKTITKEVEIGTLDYYIVHCTQYLLNEKRPAIRIY